MEGRAVSEPKNFRFPYLDDDAPQVPPGKQPKPGVYVGCGWARCTDCYEPFQDPMDDMGNSIDFDAEGMPTPK